MSNTFKTPFLLFLLAFSVMTNAQVKKTSTQVKKSDTSKPKTVSRTPDSKVEDKIEDAIIKTEEELSILESYDEMRKKNLKRPIKVEAGYINEYVTGCKVFNPNPIRGIEVNVIWSGEVKNGFAEGEGILRWFNNGHYVGKEVGSLQKGRRWGYFKRYDATNSLSFDGEVDLDTQNENGKLYSYGKLVYDGSIINGMYNGQGTAYIYNLSYVGWQPINVSYQGTYKNGVKEGYFVEKGFEDNGNPIA